MYTTLLNLDDIDAQAVVEQAWLNEHNIESCLQQLEQTGFAILDDVYPLQNVQTLREECRQHHAQFRQAEIQNGRIQEIRSDHILWIDEQLPQAQQHLTALLQFAEQLNRAFYLGIYEVEGHFAHYHVGEFYKLHRDNPQGKNGRVISTVYYLHEHWQDGYGGELRLQDKQGEWQIIAPKPNRLAIFQSDLLHEVLLSHQNRLSITAWLRQRR